MPTKQKKILLITLAIVFTGLILLLVLEKTRITNIVKLGPESEQGGPTAQEIQQEAEVNASNKKKLIEADDTNKNITTPVTGSVELSAKQEDKSSVTVFTKLYGISSGSCELTVSNNGQTESLSASVIYQTEFSICAGFSVMTDKLKTGTWNIELKVTSLGKEYNSVIKHEVN